MSANLGNSTVATGLEKVSFHSNAKEEQVLYILWILTLCYNADNIFLPESHLSFNVAYSDFCHMDINYFM